MSEQLSIFEIEIEEVIVDEVVVEEKREESVEERIENRLEIGDWVKVIARPNEDDVEQYYYLTDFHGKKGELIRIVKGKATCFEVQFPNGKIGVFYENEIMKIQGGIPNEKTIRKTTKTSSRTKRKK